MLDQGGVLFLGRRKMFLFGGGGPLKWLLSYFQCAALPVAVLPGVFCARTKSVLYPSCLCRGSSLMKMAPGDRVSAVSVIATTGPARVTESETDSDA